MLAPKRPVRPNYHHFSSVLFVTSQDGYGFENVVNCIMLNKILWLTELAIMPKCTCELILQVRMAAFQNLGGFISTFADPGKTGLYFDDEGVLVAGNPEDFSEGYLSKYFIKILSEK